MSMMLAALYTRLPHDARAPGLARRALSRLDELLSADVRRDAGMLVTEVVSNAVRHSANRNPIELAVTVDETVMRTEVRERAGTGFEPIVKHEPEQRESGWGLMLIDEISERWGVVSDHHAGACVWFELARPGDPGDPAKP